MKQIGSRVQLVQHIFYFIISNVANLATNGIDNIINLQDWPHTLRRQGNGAGGHEQGLHHVLLQDVGDAALSHIDAGRLLALGVTVAQLGDRADRVQAGVLAQRVRDNLHGLGKGLETVGVGAGECVGVLHELPGHLDLGCTAAGDQETLLHQTTDDAQGIVKRSKKVCLDLIKTLTRER